MPILRFAEEFLDFLATSLRQLVRLAAHSHPHSRVCGTSSSVHGDVRLDLLALNKIPDPFLSENNRASEWVDAYDWWYRRDIDLSTEDGTAYTFRVAAVNAALSACPT
jgi:hypothetical protein